MAKSHQLAHFLTFIVDETLAGRGDRLKAYTIATDSLGRDANFDPQADPIVRVEAGRLRRALQQYYASDGKSDPVIIALSRGGYVPEFRYGPRPSGSRSPPETLRRRLAELLTPLPRPGLLVLLVLLCGLVFLAIDILVIDKIMIGRQAPASGQLDQSNEARTPARPSDGLCRQGHRGRRVEDCGRRLSYASARAADRRAEPFRRD